MADEEQKSNIKQEYTAARAGMNLDSSVGQIQKGQISYGLNAALENYDANSTSYQNEPGNEPCKDFQFPEGYVIIGNHFIVEQTKHIFFLTHPIEGKSEIGYMDNNDCIYHTLINADCLNFSVDHPIHKAVHKITNCTTEIYWTDGFNPRRYINLDDLPFQIVPGTDVCDDQETQEIDCNKLNIQPNFAIPQIAVVDIISGGANKAGTYQFAIQYSDAVGDGYTSYYSVTNPTPLSNPQITTPNFDYPVGKSIVLDITNIDTTGYFQYFNVAVIKTINAITSVELVGTYFIDDSTHQIVYSGQNQEQIRLVPGDIFAKFPYYDVAEDITTVQDILIWKGLESNDRVNYQKIANQIKLQWQSYRIPAGKTYADELLATNFRGYLRDEVYAFEIVFLKDKGQQTDGFHIPGRIMTPTEEALPVIPDTDPDFVGGPSPAPYWRIYNTATVVGTDPNYVPNSDYEGPYQYGEFGYWRAENELYPCNENVWGALSDQPIRHHKFPDVLVSPIFESGTPSTNPDGTYTGLTMDKRAIFPIGVRLNAQQIETLIIQSDLPEEEKKSIVGFKIVRGDRNTNKSIIAKGFFRNVGKYTREGTEYYFPNYPYNDLREDPFLLEASNAYSAQCNSYQMVFSGNASYQYTECIKNTAASGGGTTGQTITICSTTFPVLSPPENAVVTGLSFDTYTITCTEGGALISFISYTYTDPQGNPQNGILQPGESVVINVKVGTVPNVYSISGGGAWTVVNTPGTSQTCYPKNLSAFEEDLSKYRHVFNSPETSFGQPYLGDYVKMENVIYGAGKGHFVEVKNNALYKLLSKEAQEDALYSSEDIAGITNPPSMTAMFTAYQAYLQVYINGITRQNYGYSYNSIMEYGYSAPIANGLGIKQRSLDISQYLIPGVQSLGDNHNINNWERESSVYLKTKASTIPLPFPSETDSLLLGGTTPLIEDKSRYINSQQDCSAPEKQFDITSVVYYGSIKNTFLDQWGQMYTYNTIDTGFQHMFSEGGSYFTVFGGDTFISQFALKVKLPFFIDNRVNAPDDSDIFYDEIGNVAYPEYWHSARSILYDWVGDNPTISPPITLTNVISVKAHNFDCPNSQLPAPDPAAVPPVINPGRTYYDGVMYMFAYGIPSFYCESSINVDLRQAYNTREGDFYPHVATGIPDDWVQETYVSIQNDNTYYYNVTYSKQNRENYFSHLPINWTQDDCLTSFPFRAIYSDSQQSFSDNRINSWLIYRPLSFFDFPQNYGTFTAIDGIENKQVLTRFYNKSLLYNALYTNVINTGGQVYLGQNLFSKDVIPLDFAETTLGYAGSQNKFLLKIPQGQIFVDAERGQVFLVSGSKAQDLSGFQSGVNRFLTDHLSFEIKNYFPNVNTDNHFKDIGLHGVYDSKYDRIIITKLDYIPITEGIFYDEEVKKFYVNVTYPTVPEEVVKEYIEVTDQEYFCNKSFTISYNFNAKVWTSFHSYLPNWYIAENNFFYSGLNQSCDMYLDAIAAEVSHTTTTSTTTTLPPPTTTTTSTSTTTTTTTSTTSTTSTTTTATPPPVDCTLAGFAAIVVLDCSLAGNAVLS